ncbi:MAG: LysM domain [Planctomycetota bacterium]
MKQNERLLVYAVTGFLAVILVIAVWFGNDAKAGTTGLNAENPGSSKESVRGLGAILDQTDPNAAAKTDANQPLVPEALVGTGEQPLNATNKPIPAAELVAQMLGPSRRDYSVRYVMPRPGDSLETLVQRWCGSRDFLDKAKRINEDLTMVRVGTEVGLPWVDDEALYEIHVARQAARVTPVAPEVFANRLPLDQDPAHVGAAPAVASTDPAAAGTAPNAVPASDSAASGRGFSDGTRISDLLRINSTPRPAVPQPVANQPVANQPISNQSGTAQPAVVQPGTGNAAPASLAGATRYEVKSGDSWWRIADRTYGRKNADKMVPELKRANPGAGDVLKVGQVLILPPKS